VTTFLIVLAIVGGLYMAWNIGANDVANAFGASVGSKALTIRRAILLAAICEFAGAFFVGAPVAQTISSDIVRTDSFRSAPQAPGQEAANGSVPEADDSGEVTLDPRLEVLATGMLCALLGAGVWLNIATFFGQPVSTTHAIIGGVVGFAVIAPSCGLECGGPGSVQWAKMGTIAASWVVSPVCGAILAYCLYRFVIRKYVLESRRPVFMAIGTLPVAFGAWAAIISFSVTYKGLPGLKLDWPLIQAVPVAIAAGVVTMVALRLVLRRVRAQHAVAQDGEIPKVEKWFTYMQISTACYMSFAHGANDVANAIGPMAAIFQVLWHNTLPASIPIPWWLLALGGAGIVLGLATYGYKVIESIGTKITEITPTRGWSADFSTATTVLVFSKLGMPISTTFVIVGAVMGVGLARGYAAIDLKVVRKIFASWLVTIPISAVLTMILFLIIMAFR
jgi:PiT family inorganic phosphate transporter